MVVPRVPSNVLAGSPVVYPAFIELARYGAEQRNFYWQHERRAKGDTEIVSPRGAQPYPLRRDQTSDQPRSGRGGKFGRLARCGIHTMDDCVREMMSVTVCGISAREGLGFLRPYAGAQPARQD